MHAKNVSNRQTHFQNTANRVDLLMGEFGQMPLIQNPIDNVYLIAIPHIGQIPPDLVVVFHIHEAVVRRWIASLQ